MANTGGSPTGLPNTAPIGAQASSGGGTYTNIGKDSQGNPIWSNSTQGTAGTGGSTQVLGGGDATHPAPLVVNSSQAETALQGAANNVQNYNSQAPTTPPTPTTPPSPTTPTTSSSAPSGASTSQQSQPTSNQYFSYTDPTSGTVSYYDAQGNAVSSVPQGVTATPLNSATNESGFPTAPTAPSFAPASSAGSTSDVSGINSAIIQGLTKIQTAGTAGISALNDYLSGNSNLLTPSQQNLISSTIQQYGYLTDLQTQSNASLVGSAQEAVARNGRYSPVDSASAVQRAVSDGLVKLAGLQASQAQAVSQMQNSFETSNYQMVLDANKQYIDAQTAMNSTLNSIADRIQSETQFVQNYQMQAAQNQFQDAMSSANLSVTEKQDAFQNYISQADLTEKQKIDAQQILDEQIANNIAAGQLALSRATFNAEWGGGSAAGGADAGELGVDPEQRCRQLPEERRHCVSEDRRQERGWDVEGVARAGLGGAGRADGGGQCER